jgi:hypothetical protein
MLVFDMASNPVKITSLGSRRSNDLVIILSESADGQVRLDTALLIELLGIDEPTRLHIDIVSTELAE